MATNKEKKSLAFHIQLGNRSRDLLMAKRREKCRHDRGTHLDRSSRLCCSFCEAVIHDPFIANWYDRDFNLFGKCNDRIQ